MSKAQLSSEQKKIRNKRTGRTRTIVGWACLIIGVMDTFNNLSAYNDSPMYGLELAILPLAMACLGVWLIMSTRKNVAKWDKYESFINPNGNTSLRMIARKTGIPLNDVTKDIQEMINNGFFRDEEGNNTAYLNGEYDILVMMKNGVPLEPVEEAAAREEKEAAEAAAENETPAGADEESYADLLELAEAKISDPDVIASMQSIEKSIRKISGQIKRHPKLQDNDSIRQLREIYLPKTVELVDKIRREDAGSAAMLEIKGMLNTCAMAYEGIVDKVYQREDEDTLIDIEVLKQTFEREGLLGSDFDIQ